MRAPGLVLETSAVVAYATGNFEVGMKLSEIADQELEIILPAACLTEAYQQAGQHHSDYLDLLAGLSNVTVTPVERDMCSVLGGWTRIVETMGMAQAAMEASSRPIVPIMTSQAEVVHRILPKEWPIIGL